MTKDEALKLALEALEWSYGGEPIPTKELEAITAIRQVLAEWTPDDTAYRPDGLNQEELLKMSSDYLTNGMAFMKAGKHIPVDEVIDRGAWSDVEDATKWMDDLRGVEREALQEAIKQSYEELPNSTTDVVEAEREACAKMCDQIAIEIEELRQALNQLPGATEMIDKDFALNVALEALYNFADDESVDGWKAIDAIGVVRKALSELPPVKSYCGGKPNYCEPPKPDLLNQTCCGCGRSGGYALYCGWCWDKGEHVDDVTTSEERVPNPDKQRHEWQWLTEEDIHDLFMSNETVNDYGEFETIICAASTKLKEKNHG